MAFSKIYNSTKRLISLLSGAQGNNSLATLGALNNLVEQLNISNGITTVYSKYDVVGPNQFIKAVNIQNGFIPGSNPANKENNPCSACTDCVQGAFLTWIGKPCWKVVTSGGSSAGCVDCASAIADISDGIITGVPGKIIHLPPLVGSPLAGQNAPARTVIEALQLPLYITAHFVEDSTNAATGENKWYLVLWNNDTDTADYSNIASITFRITFFWNTEGFVSAQGY